MDRRSNDERARAACIGHETHIANIGDLDIFADYDFVRITVDLETVITIAREDVGFREFARNLNDLAVEFD
jgi:hypothetical protein